MKLLSRYNVLVSQSGEIFRLKDNYPYSIGTDRYGYKRVYLTDVTTGKRKGEFVHRLVAELYCDNLESKPCVNHKDGNKSNSHFSNLEWCSHKENTQHAIKTGLFNPHEKEETKILRDRVIKAAYATGTFTQDELAEVFGCTQTNIIRVLKG